MTFPIVPYGAAVAIDIESCNADLKGQGPQFLFGGSDFTIGIGIFVSKTGHGEYFPISHREGNSPLNVVGWFRELLARDDITAVFANAKFDLLGLYALGIKCDCRCVDMQVTESLIDENQWSYSLGNIAKRYGLGDKSSVVVSRALIERGFVIKSGNDKGMADWSKLLELPPSIVGPYCVLDAELTMKVHLRQQDLVYDFELDEVYDLESKLVSVLFDMHIQGIAVDITKAAQINDDLLKANNLELARLQRETIPFELNSSESLSKVCRHLGFTPPQTDKEHNSVTGDWLKLTGNPHLIALAELRKSVKIQRDFILGTVLNRSYDGRLHPTFFSTRGSSFMSGDDTNGTKSGRLACTQPNLQQIPSRHPVLGPLTRSLFLPNNGDLFLKSDYQAQEIRVALHYASKLNLPGVETLVDNYNKDSLFDYHGYVRNMIEGHGVFVNRFTAKTAGLAIMYGIGRKKLSTYLNMPMKDVDKFLAAFHNAIPWVKEALAFTSKLANERGYVKTILERRRHFNRWENATWGAEWEPPLDDEVAALFKWGKIRRADTFKAFNSVVQGTSAETNKVALVTCHEEKIPILLTVHDELCASVNSHAMGKRVKEIMEQAIPLAIPTIAEAGIGTNWASCKEML